MPSIEDSVEVWRQVSELPDERLAVRPDGHVEQTQGDAGLDKCPFEFHQRDAEISEQFADPAITLYRFTPHILDDQLGIPSLYPGQPFAR